MVVSYIDTSFDPLHLTGSITTQVYKASGAALNPLAICRLFYEPSYFEPIGFSRKSTGIIYGSKSCLN